MFLQYRCTIFLDGVSLYNLTCGRPTRCSTQPEPLPAAGSGWGCQSIFSRSASFYAPTDSWCTLFPLLIAVPRLSKFLVTPSNSYSRLTVFRTHLLWISLIFLLHQRHNTTPGGRTIWPYEANLYLVGSTSIFQYGIHSPDNPSETQLNKAYVTVLPNHGTTCILYCCSRF